MGPVLSNWTGPTRLRFVVEGGGPKYERSTVVPTEGGDGNRSQPGPGPIGPGPGPCAVLVSVVVAAPAMSAGRFPSSILPGNALRGVRCRGESCANAVIPRVTTIAGAKARKIGRTLQPLKFK